MFGKLKRFVTTARRKVKRRRVLRKTSPNKFKIVVISSRGRMVDYASTLSAIQDKAYFVRSKGASATIYQKKFGVWKRISGGKKRIFSKRRKKW